MPFTRHSALRDSYNEAKETLGRFAVSAVSNSDTAISRLIDEVDFLAEIGNTEQADQIATMKLGMAYEAVSLEKVIQRLTALRESIVGFAGKKALSEAAKPIAGTRGQ
jgi:hypothetical protein